MCHTLKFPVNLGPLLLLALIYDHVIMSDSCSEKRHRSVASSALLFTMTPQQNAAHVAVYPRFARFVSQAVCANPNTSALQRMRNAGHGKLRRFGVGRRILRVVGTGIP